MNQSGPEFDLKKSLLSRFLRYVKIDSQSSDTHQDYPSTKRQFDLANLLVAELLELGLKDATVDGTCYVTAIVPATQPDNGPIVGLMAHLDTSPELSGANVSPHIIERYEGGDIVVNERLGVVVRERENPDLKQAIGHTIVTADGTTLLGADDKAGIAAIMTAVEFLVANPEAQHCEMRIAFTPDEEIGRGVKYFDAGKFGADFAYTIDGSFTGELNDETFSADAAVITITGRDMHPGTSKGLMVNSIRAMAEIVSRLPRGKAPETTSERESYVHPQTLSGSVGSSSLKVLLRDFDDNGLAHQKIILERAIAEVQALFPEAAFRLDVTPTYRNMRPELLKHPEVLSRLEKAVEKTGIIPIWKPIRGGTDGSVLTARGLPTPNIFTASCNSHSLTEWLDVDGLVKAVETVLNLLEPTNVKTAGR
jgi:tripeptide aminopeptidase